MRAKDSGALLDVPSMEHNTQERITRCERRRPMDLQAVAGLNEATDARELPWDERPMDGPQASRCRARVVRLNALSVDRAGMQFSCKDAARRMSSPANGGMTAVV